MTRPLNPEVAILNAVVELPAKQRAAYLDDACGDDAALRRNVEALLKAHEQSEGFLEAPPAGFDFRRAAEANISLTEKPGDRIGRYKLLQQIGEGGCGIVYLAEQEEPVRRLVALKIIKLGMDTKQVIARFEAERQALALMDHPNIAKVFDAGATETGRPYFVMELVRGSRMTEFCDENNLSTRNRLTLFIQVCHATQHAHQKGVIHRDIKPSNILVTIDGGTPVPKVIDFGVAKATQGRLTDQTLFTALEQFIGTPAYMSPEQAAMSSLDVDTRSDIYSLGVLLYELLTGHTPFDQRALLAAGLDGMCRTIRDVEPVKPSTRLTQDLMGNARVSRNSRSTNLNSTGEDSSREVFGATPGTAREARALAEHARKLIAALRGDLDWIVMKCLEKDRARRYETANGLARDIERHLNDEPIAARAPSGLYRFGKLVQRNKLLFAAVGVFAAALVTVAVAAAVAAWRVAGARRSEVSERQKAETANRDLRDTVRSLEFQRAESFFRNGDAGTAVAHLTAMLRRDPSNHIAGSRLISALVHRNWALRSPATMHHTGRIETLSFSPDGRHILSASRDHTAKIWDAFTGKMIAALSHAGPLASARYDASGARIVTASDDGTARIWDAATGEPRTPPLPHGGKVHWSEFSADERSVVTASSDRTARIWDVATGALKRELRAHTTPTVLARFTPDNKRIVTSGAWGSIRVWDVDSGEMLFRVEDRKSPFVTFDLSADGSRLFSICQDEILRLWNLETRTEIHLPMENKAVVHAAFSPDSRLLVTSSHDTTARLWDANTGLPVGSPLTHDGTVLSARFSPDGQKIVTPSKDHSVRVWDVHTGRLVCQPIRAPEEFTHADVSRDGLRLATAGSEGTIHVWDLQPRRFTGLAAPFNTAITTVDFSADGESLLATSFDGTARVFDARTFTTVSSLPHEPGLYLARFSPDGNRVFTACAGKVRFWDWRKGVVVAGPFEHATTIGSVHFSPKGDQAVTGDSNGVARVWNTGTWEPISPPLMHSGQVVIARFSPDSRFVATASEDHTARVWNAATGEPFTQPLLHKGHVRSVDFSADGKNILTASTDGTARVWDLQTGQPIIPPLQHTRLVEKAIFSPEGNRVITASLDYTARIWDVRTGGALTPPLKHAYSLIDISFTPDGESAMTACWNGTLRVWNTKTGQPITESLDPGDWIWRLVAFDPINRRMAVGGTNSVVRLWHVPEIPTPVPEWFLNLAEAVAGIRLGDRGQVELVSAAEFDAAVRDLKSKDKSDFYIRLAQWFLAGPANREPAPF